MKYMEQAIAEIEYILNTKKWITKQEAILIKTVIRDLLEENKKLKENNNE